MWEAIASNQRRSWFLIGLIGALLVGLGAIIGLAVVPPVSGYFHSGPQPHPQALDPYAGALYGAGAALVIWLILWIVAVSGGGSVLLSTVGARQIQKEHAPQLWNVVEEITIASGLGKMPGVYIIDEDAPNAFAVGYKPGRTAVAVTAGLLRRLNRDELQGVIAHELGHIRNLDVRFMTVAGVMVGSIVLISEVFLRSLWYGAGRRRRSSRGGGGEWIILLLAIAVAIITPLLARLLYMACSRRREYLADASAARFTRYPEGLAAALEKITRHSWKKQKVNRVVAPMYIVNPLQTRAAFSLWSTHPPVEKRVRILRNMGGRAGLADYEAAFRRVQGEKARCLGARTLAADESVSARPPSVSPDERKDVVERARAVADLLAGLAGFVFITCLCGARLKAPPDFKRPTLDCPRCGRNHELPRANAPAAEAAQGAAAPPLRFRREGAGWASFRCSCGHTVQLSPAHGAPQIRCGKCGRRIEIIL